MISSHSIFPSLRSALISTLRPPPTTSLIAPFLHDSVNVTDPVTSVAYCRPPQQFKPLNFFFFCERGQCASAITYLAGRCYRVQVTAAAVVKSPPSLFPTLRPGCQTQRCTAPLLLADPPWIAGPGRERTAAATRSREMKLEPASADLKALRHSQRFQKLGEHSEPSSSESSLTDRKSVV